MRALKCSLCKHPYFLGMRTTTRYRTNAKGRKPRNVKEDRNENEYQNTDNDKECFLCLLAPFLKWFS